MPASAFYVGGTLANTSLGDLRSIWQYLASRQDTIPSMGVFVTSGLVAQFTQGLPTAPAGTSYNGLSLTRGKTYGDITVNGNLTISGSGTYNFGAVWVTGNVVINSSQANVTMSKLHVGGSLTVGAGQMVDLGSTYVAGNTSLAGQRQWKIKVLVADGNVTIGGTQSIGSSTSPAVILMNGSGKALSYTGTGSYYGLLCNRYGSFSFSSTGKIIGSVLCAGSASMTSSASIAYDPEVGSRVFGVAPPTTSAWVNGTAVPPAPLAWYNASADVTLSAEANDWAVVTGTYHTINAGLPNTGLTFQVPMMPSPDGTYVVTYWSVDSIGNTEADRAFSIHLDTTKPTTTATPSTSDWTKGDVTVTLAASDPGASTNPATGSGVKATYYTVDGVQKPYTGTFTVSGEGLHPVTYWSEDNAGNIETAGSLTIRIDTTKPTTATPSTSDWTKGDVTVTLAASDPGASTNPATGSGVKATYYTVDGVQKPYTGTFTVSGEGLHPVTYWSEDNAGNVEDAQSIQVHIDTTKPVTGATAVPATWTNGNVVVTLSPDDAGGSGLKATRYKIGANGNPQDYSAPLEFTEQGEPTICYWSEDNAGNVEDAQSIQVHIDTTKPTGTALINDGATWTKEATVNVAVTASSDISGVAKVRFSTDDVQWTAWEAFSESKTLTLPGLDGKKTAFVQLQDGAGNESSTFQDSITLDRQAPTVTVESPAGDNVAPEPVLQYSIVDEASGSGADTSRTRVLLDEEDLGNMAPGTVITPALSDGPHTLTITGVDTAGNENETTTDFTVVSDATAPSSSHEISGTLGQNGWYTSAVEVTLSAADNDGGSGLRALMCSLDGEEPVAVDPALGFTVSAQGPHTLEYWAVDNAENVEGAHQVEFKIDGIAPADPDVADDSTWHNDVVTVIATGGSDPEPGSGSRIQYNVDGEWVDGAGVELSAQGVNAVSFRSIDNAGNVSGEVSTTRSIDTWSPSEPWVDQDNRWHNTPVSVTADDASDDGPSSGFHIQYCIDGQIWIDGASVTLSAEGRNHVSFRTIDGAGNTSTQVSTSRMIDTQAPSIPSLNGDDAWHSTAVTVTASGSIDPSPSSDLSYQHRLSTSGAWVPGASYIVPADGTTEGENIVQFRAVDGAGNASQPATATVKIYSGAPTIRADGAPTSYWTNEPVTLTFVPKVGPFTPAAVTCDLGDGLGWRSLLPDVDGAYRLFPFEANGEYSIDFRVTDSQLTPTVAEGHVEFGIDRTAPEVSLEAPNGAATGYNRPVFRFSASDAGGSALASADPVARVDGQLVEAVSDHPLPLPLANGDHVFSFVAKDVAGSVTTVSYPFRVDAPAFTVKSPNPDEGDVVGLYADDGAETGNPDGSWTGKSWEWTVTEGDLEPLTFEGPIAFVVPDAPTSPSTSYGIRLVVTDTAEGGTGAKCETQQDLAVGGLAPRVHALDVEVLAGQPAKLMGRFLDPGWLQKHTATWTIDGIAGQVAGKVTEDNLGAMDTGTVEGVTTSALAPSGSSYSAHLTVMDSTGRSATDDFKINVVTVDPTVDDEAGNGIGAATPKLYSGGRTHLSYIQSSTDVDIYEVTLPNTDPVPYGTEVLVTLTSADVDCDLAVVQDLGADAAVDAGLEGSSFSSAGIWESAGGYKHMPVDEAGGYKHMPYEDIGGYKHMAIEDAGGYKHMPFYDCAYLYSGGYKHMPYNFTGGYKHMPYEDAGGYKHMPPLLSALFTHTAPVTAPDGYSTLDGYSFSDMSFAGLDTSMASGSAVKFEELGFDNSALANKRVAGFSAHVGTGTEVVLAQTDFVDGHTYILVKGANGASSTAAPYTLQVETSMALHLPDILNEGIVEQPKVPEGPDDSQVIYTHGGAPATLFVAQPERFNVVSKSDQAWATVLQPLKDACDSDYTGGGAILTIPPTLPEDVYDAWDKQPWDTQLANTVTEEVRKFIEEYLYGDPADPGDDRTYVKYVVVVGGDDVIPQRRVQDQTVLGNERAYADSSWLKSTSPLLASMFDSMVLTDDYYVDHEPMPFNGRSLYIPDLAVARLVETPSEIAGRPSCSSCRATACWPAAARS